MELKKTSSEQWVKFYKKSKGNFISDLHRYFLNSFQQIIFNEIQKKVKQILKQKKDIKIISIGSGIDTIAYKLKRFNDKIDISIFDVSPICIDKNRQLFGNNFRFIVGDMFTYNFEDEKYDLVYNTGLLEHFTEKEQDEIITKIHRSLKKGGYYITLNPHTGGKIYIKCMKNAIKTGRWKYGEEIPIKSLKKFSKDDFQLIKEYPCCSLLQLGFLLFTNRLLFLLLSPIIIFSRIFYIKPIDGFFGRYVGFYSLVSVFKKI